MERRARRRSWNRDPKPALRTRRLGRAGDWLASGSEVSRLRTDDTLTPDFRGVVETTDGAAILFTLRGYVRTADDGMRQLVGAMTHISHHERYQWLNNVICAVTGVLEPRADGHGSEVLLEISSSSGNPPARDTTHD